MGNGEWNSTRRIERRWGMGNGTRLGESSDDGERARNPSIISFWSDGSPPTAIAGIHDKRQCTPKERCYLQERCRKRTLAGVFEILAFKEETYA